MTNAALAARRCRSSYARPGIPVRCGRCARSVLRFTGGRTRLPCATSKGCLRRWRHGGGSIPTFRHRRRWICLNRANLRQGRRVLMQCEGRQHEARPTNDTGWIREGKPMADAVVVWLHGALTPSASDGEADRQRMQAAFDGAAPAGRYVVVCPSVPYTSRRFEYSRDFPLATVRAMADADCAEVMRQVNAARVAHGLSSTVPAVWAGVSRGGFTAAYCAQRDSTAARVLPVFPGMATPLWWLNQNIPRPGPAREHWDFFAGSACGPEPAHVEVANVYQGFLPGGGGVDAGWHERNQARAEILPVWRANWFSGSWQVLRTKASKTPEGVWWAGGEDATCPESEVCTLHAASYPPDDEDGDGVAIEPVRTLQGLTHADSGRVPWAAEVHRWYAAEAR